MVGMCASGRREDCRNGYASHYAKCCDYETKKFEKWGTANLPGSNIPFQYPEYSFEKGSGGNCRWRYGKYGEYVKCQNGQIVKGMCASGMNRDCKITSSREYPGRDPYWWNGKYYNYNAIYCCDM